MNIQPLISILQPKSDTTSSVIFNILVLEDKLASPENQSEYFRWGIQSQIELHTHLLKQYESIRKNYNRMPLDELISRLIERQQFLKDVVPPIRPRFARSMIYGSTVGQISILKDYIQLKARIDMLPPIEELRLDSELLLQILD
jgi:hypothetical protein